MSLVLAMLSDAAVRRLAVYCRRAALTKPEFVEQNGRNVRHIGRELRALIYSDTEVRRALLHTDYGELAQRVPPGQGLSLLDLVTAMALEHERRTVARAA